MWNLLLSAAVAAPAAIPMHGVLTDSTGAPLDGAHPVTVTLYGQGVSGYGPFWTRTFTVALNHGAFSVVLEAGAPSLSVEAFRDHTDVRVGVAWNGVESPLVALGQAPYAAYAAHAGDAATLGGIGPTGFVRGDYQTGNLAGQVPVSNGARSVDLNADLLDGLSSADFVRGDYAAGNSAGAVAVNNGALNATLNADLLDGVDSTSFVRGSFTAGNANGNVPVSNGTVNTNLNADLLDGLSSGVFARLDQANSFTQNVGAPGFNGAYVPAYSAYTAAGLGAGGAAIYNDNGSYKSLMILGNTNHDGTNRRIRMWDDTYIERDLSVARNVASSGNLTIAGTASVTGNTGVGKPASSMKLDVAGDVNVDGVIRTNHPWFSVSDTGCWRNGVNDNWVEVSWNDVRGGNDGGWFNTANGRFTAPVTGLYLFSAVFYHHPTSGQAYSTYLHYTIGVNGARQTGGGQGPSGTYSITQNNTGNHHRNTEVNRLLFLNAGDYASLHVYNGGGAGTYMCGYHSLFQGALLTAL